MEAILFLRRRRARLARPTHLGAALAASMRYLEAIAASVQIAWVRWRRAEDDLDDYATLDDATLRDLAVTPGELPSYSFEAADVVPCTRRRVACVTLTAWRESPPDLPEC